MNEVCLLTDMQSCASLDRFLAALQLLPAMDLLPTLERLTLPMACSRVAQARSLAVLAVQLVIPATQALQVQPAKWMEPGLQLVGPVVLRALLTSLVPNWVLGLVSTALPALPLSTFTNLHATQHKDSGEN
jgi:hypothetical protein